MPKPPHPLLELARAAYEPAESLSQWVDRMTCRAAQLRGGGIEQALWGGAGRVLDERTGQTVGDFCVHSGDPRMLRLFHDYRPHTMHRMDFLMGGAGLRSARAHVESGEAREDAALQRMHEYFMAGGLYDMLHLTAFDGNRHWVTVGIVFRAPYEREWAGRSEALAASYFAAGLQLQATAFQLSQTIHLDGDVHAPERSARPDALSTKGLSSRQHLRVGVRALLDGRAACGAEAGATAAAITCWQGIIERTWSLVDMHDHEGRRYLIAMRNLSTVADHRGLSAREAQVAAFVAEGCSMKWIAHTLGIAEATVSTHLNGSLTKLGLPSAMALARGFRRYVLDLEQQGCLGLECPTAPAIPFPAQGLKVLRLSLNTTALSLALTASSPLLERLSPRERVVVDLALVGLSDKEIAARLGRSRHTIGNQLRRAYARLGVNSRVELSAKLSDEHERAVFADGATSLAQAAQ